MMLFLDLIMEAVKYVIAGYALFGRKVKTRHGLGIIVAACGIVFVGNIADSAGKASVLILPFFFNWIVDYYGFIHQRRCDLRM